ncbi:MAG: MucR family transcriptional regulator [Holosporales bacterium]|jgi:predicted transcriptional regulator|nr:MucR family transcriptional regulator [Holosporales bacterium]
MTDCGDVFLTKKELIELAAKLTAAYLSSNNVQISDVNSVMHSFFQVLSEINKSSGLIKGRLPVMPAVPIEESVHENYIVCLEDGKKLQMLKRHLSTVYKMTIEEYKERWNLGPEYPVVSPNYARRRSGIAKNTGLGRTGRRKMKIVDSGSGSAIVA